MSTVRVAPALVIVSLIACSASEGNGPAPAVGGAAGAGGGSGWDGGSSGGWPASGGASGEDAAAGSGGAAGADCKTDCLGNECGTAMPDCCGSTLDCGDCGPGTDLCIVGKSDHSTAVHNAHIAIQNDHPSWFDTSDKSGSGAKLLDLDSFRNELVSRMNALGKVAISDPNDAAEIRVRAASANSADNFRVVTSSGYSWDKYTSTCTPAGF